MPPSCAGRGGPTGVLATDSIDEILALGADCVLYMPQACNFDEVCRLLESGANIVTTRGEFQYPPGMDQSVRDRVEAACQRGGTSIHGTGSSPGFISEAVPLVLTSTQRHLDSLSIEEYADLSRRNSPVLLFELMGYGKDPETFDRGRWAHGEQSFGPTLRLVADALGLPLDSVEASGEVATASRTTEIAAGTIEAGTVAAQRLRVQGLRSGKPLVSFMATWYCTTDLDPVWDLRATGWRLFMAGDAPLDVEMRFAVPLEDMGEWSPGYTANRAVNAVPVVCAAAPGIRTTVDLPQIIATTRRAGRPVRPLPELTPATEWFWTSGADGQLRIQRCTACATLVHPPVPICPACRSREWEPSVVSGRGSVIGYTVNEHRWHPDFDPPVRDRRGGAGRGPGRAPDHLHRGLRTLRRAHRPRGRGPVRPRRRRVAAPLRADGRRRPRSPHAAGTARAPPAVARPIDSSTVPCSPGSGGRRWVDA